LVKSCKNAALFLNLLKLWLIIIIKNHVGAQDPLHYINRFSGDSAHATVTDGQNGDGLAGVDLLGEASLSEEVVEGGEVRIVGKNAGDVEGGGGRR